MCSVSMGCCDQSSREQAGHLVRTAGCHDNSDSSILSIADPAKDSPQTTQQCIHGPCRQGQCPILRMIQLRYTAVSPLAQGHPVRERQSWSLGLRVPAPTLASHHAVPGTAPAWGSWVWTLQSTRHLPSLPHSHQTSQEGEAPPLGAVSPVWQEEMQRGQALAQGHPASRRRPALTPASSFRGALFPFPALSSGCWRG